ncbi:MAG: hypothetical protein QX199_19695, partial [Methylococcaceae bacterium]
RVIVAEPREQGRVVYNDERAAWECGQGALRRESWATSAYTGRSASSMHSHVARGNEVKAVSKKQNG